MSPFFRKIIYLACIGGLLIAMSRISRPETRNPNGSINDPGGELSVLRQEYNLSQAKMSEIDPASETMKLASLGLRGVAVNILWMQALEHQDKENYDQLASTLQSLIRVQPNFVKVWEYQAHNLAYNVSMEFDDYEYRHHWVKKGINFLKQGIPYNKRDHRISDKLGFFIGNKFGKSDEQMSFRRMFRKDSEFHQDMADYIDPESYDQRDFGPDSWLLAWQWYDYSQRLVDVESCDQHITDMLFRMYRPSQVRNQALSLQKEFKTDETTQEVWRDSFDQWIEYGNREISNTQGTTITLEGMAKRESELESLRQQLDQIVPAGTRDGLVEDLIGISDLTDEQKRVLDIPVDERNDEQILLARKVNQMLKKYDTRIDSAVAFYAPEKDRYAASKIAAEIEKIHREIQSINENSSTVNYPYWRARNQAESEVETREAQRALFEAREKWQQSIYDDEYDFDYRTKKKTITQRGAISRYFDAFSQWKKILEKYPELSEGSLAHELSVAMKEYMEMLVSTNREWPDDFPLQKLIDERALAQLGDGLPTTEEVEEMRSNREMDEEEVLEEVDKAPPATEQDDSEAAIDQAKDSEDEAKDSDGQADKL